jgi:hypothetical protein
MWGRAIAWAWWLCLLCAALGGVAQAADRFATVDAIFAPTPSGEWRPVTSNANARVITAGTSGDGEALAVGDRLEVGDRVTTAMVRVRLRLRGDEQLVIGEGADLVLAERSVLQQVGDALYRVHGVFRVGFGAVEAAVEGTRFVVAPDGVDVLAGRVRVTGAGGSEVGARQQHVEVSAATPAPPAPMSPSQRAHARDLGMRLGMPASSLGVELGGGHFGLAGTGSVQLVARFGFLGAGEVYVESGVAFQRDRFHLPVAVGLGWRLGWFRVGGGGALRIGVCEDCTGGQTLEVLAGGQVQVGLLMPLSGRLSFSVTGRVSVLQDRWTLDGAAGLAVGF